MSNGTLTPPPLSAVEIHDQAKDVLNAPPPTVAPPPPQPPVVATPTIQQQHQQSNLGAAKIHSALDSIQRNEFSVAITKLERLDMNVRRRRLVSARRVRLQVYYAKGLVASYREAFCGVSASAAVHDSGHSVKRLSFLS